MPGPESTKFLVTIDMPFGAVKYVTGIYRTNNRALSYGITVSYLRQRTGFSELSGDFKTEEVRTSKGPFHSMEDATDCAWEVIQKIHRERYGTY